MSWLTVKHNICSYRHWPLSFVYLQIVHSSCCFVESSNWHLESAWNPLAFPPLLLESSVSCLPPLPADPAFLWLPTWWDLKSFRACRSVTWTGKTQYECGRHQSVDWCSRLSIGESWASLFLSWSEQLIHSSSLAFPTTKDCTLKLSKDKPFLGLRCTQTFSHQQRKFLDNPLLSSTLLLSVFKFLLSFPRGLKWSFRFVPLPLNKMQWASWWLSIQLWIFKPKDSNYLLYVFLSTSSRHLH